nr:hypothetical protein [Tanacetum cinerariifolium]
MISHQAAATWQHPIRQPPVMWHPRQRRSTPQDHRSMATDYQSTAAVYGGDRRSMVAVNDGRRWRTIVNHRRTTFYHHRSTVVDRPGQVRSWTGSGSGHGPRLDQVGSATWHATCQPRVLTWHLRGCCRGYYNNEGVKPKTSSSATQGLPQEPAELEHTYVIYMQNDLFNLLLA